eukprot:scaffold2003_cov157-Amphora_coffeaeformis.AAC.8
MVWRAPVSYFDGTTKGDRRRSAEPPRSHQCNRSYETALKLKFAVAYDPFSLATASSYRAIAPP